MRTVASIAGAFAVSTAAWLVACASDENASHGGPDDQTSVPAIDASVMDAISEAGDATVEEPCLPDALCPLGPFAPSTPGGPLDLRTRIQVIRGRSASDVWAVGAVGGIAHFDGTSWARSESGAIESLSAMWLLASGEVALARMSTVYARNVDLDGPDGGAPSAGGWMRTSTPAILWPLDTPSFLGVITSAWAPSDAEWLWGTTLVRNHASIQANENGLWRARIAPETRTLELAPVLPSGACREMGCLEMLGIHGSSADDLWAVGVTGATFHITEAQSASPNIVAFDSQTWAGLEGVWAASATEAWAVGGVGTIRHYTGSAIAWDIVGDVPATENLHAVWGTSSSDVWAVGDGATVLHYDGAIWSRLESGASGCADRTSSQSGPQDQDTSGSAATA